MAKSKLDAGTRRAARQGLMVVIVALLTLEATALLQYYYSKRTVTLEANRRAYASVESELQGLQDKTADLEQQLTDTGKQFEEAVDVIEDVTAKWLYKESTAATARANLAEIDRTAEEREQFRLQKEAEAALRSQGRPAGRSFRTFFARKRKG